MKVEANMKEILLMVSDMVLEGLNMKMEAIMREIGKME